jgi:hypothetical protein
MYEHLRTSLKQMEERNFELETKFTEVWYNFYPVIRHSVVDTGLFLKTLSLS